MRALIADAGNTRVCFAAWELEDRLPVLDATAPAGFVSAPPLRVVAELPTPRSPAAETAFREAAVGLVAGLGAPRVFLVSVVPRVTALLAGAGLDVHMVDHTCGLPFDHELIDPAATGADRLCNVAAAIAVGVESAFVVDAGTATTCDVIVDGVFLGGLIAPGMAFALDQLAREAARLDPVPFADGVLQAGRDMRSALSAGAFHAGVGGVEYLISGLQRRYGSYPVILTGGLGRHLLQPARFLDQHWTLRGAAFLAGLVR